MTRPAKVRLVEVGPRDGLQNEPQLVSVDISVELIERLAVAGLTSIEVGAIVSPTRVPQMARTAEVYQRLKRQPGTSYPVLVANFRGLEAALQADVKEIAVFVSASEGFSQHNVGCTRAESLARLMPVARTAHDHGLNMRGYVSCITTCPYNGAVAPETVAEMAARLADLGCTEIALGETTGAGTADAVRRVIASTAARLPLERVAMHFHDTYGQGTANVLASLEEGISVFDSSVAGLGGCPYAPGASGNVATEDLLYLLHGLGIETGVNLAAVAETGGWISRVLNRVNSSRAGSALLAHMGKPPEDYK